MQNGGSEINNIKKADRRWSENYRNPLVFGDPRMIFNNNNKKARNKRARNSRAPNNELWTIFTNLCQLYLVICLLIISQRKNYDLFFWDELVEQNTVYCTGIPVFVV